MLITSRFWHWQQSSSQPGARYGSWEISTLQGGRAFSISGCMYGDFSVETFYFHPRRYLSLVSNTSSRHLSFPNTHRTHISINFGLTNLNVHLLEYFVGENSLCPSNASWEFMPEWSGMMRMWVELLHPQCCLCSGPCSPWNSCRKNRHGNTWRCRTPLTAPLACKPPS